MLQQFIRFPKFTEITEFNESSVSFRKKRQCMWNTRTLRSLCHSRTWIQLFLSLLTSETTGYHRHLHKSESLPRHLQQRPLAHMCPVPWYRPRTGHLDQPTGSVLGLSPLLCWSLRNEIKLIQTLDFCVAFYTWIQVCKVYSYRLHAQDPVILWGFYVCTQRIHWIHFEAFIAETYVQLVATEAMCYSTGWSALACANPRGWLTLALYCAVSYIAACVDVSRTVFRDRSSTHFAITSWASLWQNIKHSFVFRS